MSGASQIMDDIDSLDKLILALDKAEKKEVPAILKRLQITKKDLDRFSSWCADGYTRNCIHRTDAYELILLCWTPGCITPIHDHGGQDCWVYQAVGSVTERRFEKDSNGYLVETNLATLEAGNITYMSDEMGYHSLSNETEKGSYTIHLYSSPIENCEVYNDEMDRFENKEMIYDTVPDDLVGI